MHSSIVECPPPPGFVCAKSMLFRKESSGFSKLSCVCGSVRISNFLNHITKMVTFSASLLLSIRWYLFKDGFSKAHQLNYTVQGGNVSFVSDVAWLHNRHYPVVWMYSLTCIQPGGDDDHADQRKALRTQSICSRSMVTDSTCQYVTIPVAELYDRESNSVRRSLM